MIYFSQQNSFKKCFGSCFFLIFFIVDRTRGNDGMIPDRGLGLDVPSTLAGEEGNIGAFASAS